MWLGVVPGFTVSKSGFGTHFFPGDSAGYIVTFNNFPCRRVSHWSQGSPVGSANPRNPPSSASPVSEIQMHDIIPSILSGGWGLNPGLMLTVRQAFVDLSYVSSPD